MIRTTVGLLISIVAGLSLLQVAGPPSGPAEPAEASLVEIEFGDLPIVLSVPHAGSLRPDEIPDRRFSEQDPDPWARELVLLVAQRIEDRTGLRPHLIVNPYHRARVDPDTDLYDGARRNPLAVQVWTEYHAAIEQAGSQILAQCGWGHYFDLHTTGQDRLWIELGYGLTPRDLSQRDEYMGSHSIVSNAAIRTLLELGPFDLNDLIRGEASLGGLLQERGYAAVPSPIRKSADYLYQEGMFSIDRHGSRQGGGLNATKIDVPAGLLNPDLRAQTASDLADAMLGFLSLAYGFRFDSPGAPVCPPYPDLNGDTALARALEPVRGQVGEIACRTDPHLYCPEGPISRGDAAVLIAAHFPAGLPQPHSLVPGAGTNPLDGLDQAVNELWSRGLLDLCAYSPPRYCPERPWTRADAARVLLRARFGPAFIPRPPDKGQRAIWDEWWLEAAEDYGLIDPCGSAGFCGDLPVTRGQAAVWIDRAVGR